MGICLETPVSAALPDNGQIHRMQFPDGAYLVPTNRHSREMWWRSREIINDATGHVVIVGPNNTFIGVGPTEHRARS